MNAFVLKPQHLNILVCLKQHDASQCVNIHLIILVMTINVKTHWKTVAEYDFVNVAIGRETDVYDFRL